MEPKVAEKLIKSIEQKIKVLKEEKIKSTVMLRNLQEQYKELAGELPEDFETELTKVKNEYEKLQDEFDTELRKLKSEYPELFK